MVKGIQANINEFLKSYIIIKRERYLTLDCMVKNNVCTFWLYF